jgi:hypothetical protein
MCRFALHRGGQSSHVTMGWHAMVPTDRAKGFLPAVNGQVFTAGEIR